MYAYWRKETLARSKAKDSLSRKERKCSMRSQKRLFLSFVIALLLGLISPVFAQNVFAAPDCGDADYNLWIVNYQFVFTYTGEGQPQQELDTYTESRDDDSLVKTTIPLMWEPNLCGGVSANIGQQPYSGEWVKFGINAMPITDTGQVGRWANVEGKLVRRDNIPALWILMETEEGNLSLLWCPSNLQATVPDYLPVSDSRQLAVPKPDDLSDAAAEIVYEWHPDWIDTGTCKQAVMPFDDAQYVVGIGFTRAASKGHSFMYIGKWTTTYWQFGTMIRRWYDLRLPFVTNGG